jgi:NAD(P)-dependent dehydrogenase (short-subunit alcohol dehydrogenase family)
MFIITGASDGLGLAIAKALITKGKTVVCLSRTQPKSEKINWVQVDLTDENSITKAAEGLLSHKDKFEAFINCAAVTSYEDIDKLTAQELDRIFKTNVTAPMLLTSKLLPRIKEDVADVVNIGATIALKAGYAQQSAYSTTKWALRGFTQNLSEELKPTGCRVISLLLGGFNSKMHEKVTGKPIADPENWMRPEDIAALLLQILDQPKNMEISEIIVNRKSRPLI